MTEGRGELLYSMALHHEQRVRQRAYEQEQRAIDGVRQWAERKLAEEFPEGAPPTQERKAYRRYGQLLYAQRHPERVHAVKKRTRQTWALKNADALKDYQHDYKQRRHASKDSWDAPAYRQMGHPDHDEWKRHNAAYQYRKKFIDRQPHPCSDCGINQTFATICKSCAAKRGHSAQRLLKQLKSLETA